jgi:prepilin-type N-terminal cleavage/methylation domain-containing protein
MILESMTAKWGKVLGRAASAMPPIDDKGITLIEVMIATALFLVIALGLTTLNAGTWHNTHSSKSYTEGSVLAAQQLEDLFSRKYAGTSNSGMSSEITAGDHGPFYSDDGRYSVTYRVKDDDIMPDTKTVQMVITFDTHGGKSNEVIYNYLLPLRK